MIDASINVTEARFRRANQLPAGDIEARNEFYNQDPNNPFAERNARWLYEMDKARLERAAEKARQ